MFCVQVNGAGISTTYFNSGSIEHGTTGQISTILNLKAGDVVSLGLNSSGNTRLLGNVSPNNFMTPSTALRLVRIE